MCLYNKEFLVMLKSRYDGISLKWVGHLKLLLLNLSQKMNRCFSSLECWLWPWVDTKNSATSNYNFFVSCVSSQNRIIYHYDWGNFRFIKLLEMNCEVFPSQPTFPSFPPSILSTTQYFLWTRWPQFEGLVCDSYSNSKGVIL